MREEILLALVAACKDLTGISKQTLGVFATEMAKTVTEKSGIEAAVAAQLPILESIQGNLRFESKKAVEQYKEKNPAPKEETAEEKAARLKQEEIDKKAAEGQGQNGLSAADVAKIVAEAIKPITEKIAGADREKSLADLKSKTVDFIAKTYGSLNDNEQKRSDMAFANVLLKNPNPESVEKLHEAWKAEFDDISSGLGLSALTPSTGESHEDEKSAELLALKQRMQEKGVLPKSEK